MTSTLSRLPLEDTHIALGATFGEERGWSLPTHYGDPATELAALRSGAGLIDLSDRGLVVATGSERIDFLQGQLSNDMKALPPGQACRATLLTRKGKMISDMVVSAFDDRHLLDTEPDRAEPTLAALDRFLISEDAELEDATGSVVRLAIVGPDAARVVTAAVGIDAADLGPREHRPLEGPSGAGAGIAPRLARRDTRGLPGFELWLDPGDGAALLERLREAGATPIGRSAWDLASLEAGEARFGLDMDEGSNPLEAHLQDAISYTKGCYVGQEVIAKATHLGRVGKLLMGLRLEGEVPPPPGSDVQLDGESVGRVTRGALSPTLGVPIALAILKRKAAETGTRVELHAGDGSSPRSAEVVALPFVKDGT